MSVLMKILPEWVFDQASDWASDWPQRTEPDGDTGFSRFTRLGRFKLTLWGVINAHK